MFNQRFATMVVLGAASAFPAASQSHHFSITQAQVAAAINDAGIQVSAGQVALLSNVISASDNPALKVESVEKWDDRKVMVRLECANPGECLPFIVTVPLSEATQDRAVLTPWLRPPSFSGKLHGSEAIRAGSTAVLFLEGPHVHIQLPVVCLENGSIGQSIRVATRDRRLTFTAEILNDSTLRGQL